MPSIRTVNLIWERKVRGSYAVSRFALADTGTVALVLPRPLEPRTYDLTRLAVDEAAEVRATFAVETLLELEASAESDAVIGMTSDDLYLIHGGSKSRFMPDKRIILVDSALSADGRTVVVGFSDVAGSSFALAVGDISGKLSWLREADTPLSAVAVSAEGALICQAAECGSIRLLDAARREHWLFEQDEPVSALACAPRGRFTAYGTKAGGVGVIDAEGSRVWDARLPGDIAAIGVSMDGALTAALVRAASEEGTARICLLDSTGQVGWEHEAEGRLTGLAVSPNGRYLAVSARNGTHTLYEIVFGEAGSGADGSTVEELLRRAESKSDGLSTVQLVQALTAALKERPAETAACERLLELQRSETERLLGEAREQCGRQEFAAAFESLDLLRGIAPDEPELYQLLREVRESWAAREVVVSDACIATGDIEGAGAILHGVLRFAPHNVEARRRLADLAVRKAAEADAEAESLMAQADIEAGLAALERAQKVAASAERAERIRAAQTEMEYAEGMRAYEAKRYREAVFQFKKVLARDPNHADARRHLNFAQNFELDSNEALNDRFGRLE